MSGNNLVYTELTRLLGSRDVDALKAYCHSSIATEDINQQDWGGLTPLMLAAQQGSLVACQIFLAKGADIHVKDDNFSDGGGHDALHFAARNGHTDVVKALIDHGACAPGPNNVSHRAFHSALWNKHIDTVLVLIDAGVDVSVNFKGASPLNHATDLNNSKVLKRLLDLSPDRAAAATSALASACRKDKPQMVSLLLQAGAIAANVQKKDLSAIFASSVDCAKVLIKSGANIRTLDNDGRSALHHACDQSKPGVVEFLISQGLDIHATDALGMTPLMMAANRPALDCVQLLLDAGANPKSRDHEGKTAFDYALQFSIMTGFMQSTPILLSHIDDESLIDQAIEPIERVLEDGQSQHENLVDLLRAHKAKLQADSAMRQIASIEFSGATP